MILNRIKELITKIKEDKAKAFIIAFVAIIFVFVIMPKVFSGEDEMEKKNEKDDFLYVESKDEGLKEHMYIHLDGAVLKPGMIEIQKGDRLKNAIEKAGGLKDDADLKYINFAMILSDGEKIYIPFKNAEENAGNGIISYVPEVEEKNKKVNINRANKEELMKVKGIGDSTADKIIKYRKDKGLFKKASDIMKIQGISDKKFESIKDDITV